MLPPFRGGLANGKDSEKERALLRLNGLYLLISRLIARLGLRQFLENRPYRVPDIFQRGLQVAGCRQIGILTQHGSPLDLFSLCKPRRKTDGFGRNGGFAMGKGGVDSLPKPGWINRFMAAERPDIQEVFHPAVEFAQINHGL